MLSPVSGIVDRLRGSTPVAIASAVAVGLLLAVTTPVLAGLGGHSAPVGCASEPVGSHSTPCDYFPTSGSDDSGVDDSGVVNATPTFAG